jgi:hypothetical protein
VTELAAAIRSTSPFAPRPELVRAHAGQCRRQILDGPKPFGL